MVELIKAITGLIWPVALIVVFISAAVIIFRVFRPGTNPNLKFNVPGKTELVVSYDGNPQKIDNGTIDGLIATPSSSTDASLEKEESAKEDIKENEKYDSSYDIIFNNDPSIFEEKISKFKESEIYKNNPDFWGTWIITRRRTLGLGGAPEEYKLLSKQNPTWIWPLIQLLKDATHQRSLSEGDDLISQLQARKTDANVGDIISEAINFFWITRGCAEALKFARSNIEEGLSDSALYTLLHRISNLFKEDSDPVNAAFFAEAALRKNPSANKDAFDLSYIYAENEYFRNFALSRYYSLHNSNYKNANVENNMGVLFTKFGEFSLQIEFYEKGIAEGSSLAACNIAIALANAGFITRAEKLLSEITDYTGDEENKASADELIHEKKRKNKAAMSSIVEKSRNEYGKYQSFITETLSYWQGGGAFDSDQGDYIDATGNIKLRITENELTINVTEGSATLTGTCPRKGIIHGVYIRDQSTSLLGGALKYAILGVTGSTKARILLWETESSQLKIKIFDTTRIQS